MTCGFTAARRAQILARIARWETQLTNAYTTLDTLTSHDIQEYRFNSGEGSQWAEKRKIREHEELIDLLERKIDHWVNRLAGRGIIYNSVARRG